MSQITRCPQCQTRFKVVDDQLRISDGWVRCGKCKTVFDALAHLVAHAVANPVVRAEQGAPGVSPSAHVAPPPAPAPPSAVLVTGNSLAIDPQANVPELSVLVFPRRAGFVDSGYVDSSWMSAYESDAAQAAAPPTPQPADRQALESEWSDAVDHRPESLRNSTVGFSAQDDLAELQAREALNGLYVAITRARSSVLVSATENSRSPANNWWALLQQHVKPESYAQLSSALKAPSTKAAEPPLEVIQMAQLPQLVATASVPTLNTQISDTAASAESRRGQALHRLLEWQVQGDLSPQIQARLMRDYQLEAAECLALAAQAQQMQSGPAAWIWDAAHITWGANELELAHEGQVLRLDRLVQATSSQDWWVIDYKSALNPEHDAALQAQMQQYCLAVQAWQGASARVRGAWVTGAGRWAELAAE